MAKLSPALTLWVLIPVPFVVIAVRYFGQIIHRLSEKIQASLGVLSTRAQENLTGIRVIRAYVQEKPRNRGVRRGEPRLREPEHQADRFLEPVLPRAFRADRVHRGDSAGSGRRQSDRPPRVARNLFRVLRISDPADFPDDRDRLGDQYFSARRRVHGPAALHPDGRARTSATRLRPRPSQHSRN